MLKIRTNNLKAGIEPNSERWCVVDILWAMDNVPQNCDVTCYFPFITVEIAVVDRVQRDYFRDSRQSLSRSDRRAKRASCLFVSRRF
jgi:hypothetical protein